MPLLSHSLERHSYWKNITRILLHFQFKQLTPYGKQFSKKINVSLITLVNTHVKNEYKQEI